MISFIQKKIRSELIRRLSQGCFPDGLLTIVCLLLCCYSNFENDPGSVENGKNLETKLYSSSRGPIFH